MKIIVDMLKICPSTHSYDIDLEELLQLKVEEVRHARNELLGDLRVPTIKTDVDVSPAIKILDQILDLMEGHPIEKNLNSQRYIIAGSEVTFHMESSGRDLPALVRDIWDHTSKYSDYADGSSASYYSFLKYLDITSPDGSARRLDEFYERIARDPYCGECIWLYPKESEQLSGKSGKKAHRCTALESKNILKHNGDHPQIRKNFRCPGKEEKCLPKEI